MLKPFAQKIASAPWILLASIAVVLAIPRFFFMLNGMYNAIAIIFVVMMALPLLLMTKTGRQESGMKKPTHVVRLVLSFLVGIVISLSVFWLGLALYDHSSLNWYVAIMSTIKGVPLASVKASPGLFAVVALPAVIFSPLGEEFFFRGMLHEAFSKRFAILWAYSLDAIFFAVTHLAHYGLSHGSGGGVSILLPSALFWMLLMGIAAVVFALAKKYSETIWGAVFCHAGFNLAMMWCICYRLA